MKNKWSKYALKAGKVQESYIREYCNRKKVRQATEASDSNCDEQSGQAEEEIVVKPKKRRTRKKKVVTQ